MAKNSIRIILNLFRILKARLSFYKDCYSGAFVIIAISAIYFISLYEIFSYSENISLDEIYKDSYLRHIIYFSFFQALLSSFLSILIGFLFARAFFYQNFPGKRMILKLLSLTFVLPTLVVIFGLIGIYGQTGLLAKIFNFFGYSFSWNFYGLSGILIAHLFFNIPLAARIFLQGFKSVPYQQRQLAAQLNIRGWNFMRLIEFPYIKQQIFSIFVMVFMLCFTSFTIVLTLGGGPKYTTLEVAIYQAIFFDFDLAKAAIYALFQFFFCFILFGAASFFSKSVNTEISNKIIWLDRQSKLTQIWQISVIFLVVLFILLPLANLIFSSFDNSIFKISQNKSLCRALLFSIALSFSSGVVSVFVALSLSYLSRRLNWQRHYYLANNILNFGMLILAIPTLVLALGLFLLLREIDFDTIDLFIVVVICNAFMALPFVIKILDLPMNNNMQYYEKLCESLDIKGLGRFFIIEWHNLKAPIKYAFAIACALSLGDFTAISLFGNQDFTSLPRLLYEQLASYQMKEASLTALVMLFFCAIIFYLVDDYDKY